MLPYRPFEKSCNANSLRQPARPEDKRVKLNRAALLMALLVSLAGCGEEPAGTAERAERSTGGREPVLEIEILTIKGCQATPPTIELVKSTADEMGVSYRVDIITVENHGHANELRFIGSPSVRLDGVDIDPGADRQKHYGVT
jgi:hypothetical protein